MGAIVTKLSESTVNTELIGYWVEPVFWHGMLSDELYANKMIVYLAYNITRNATDLNSHVKRIYLMIQTNKTENLYSALVDLFLVLENNGTALRKRLLAYARKHINQSEYLYLQQSLRSGHISELKMPMAKQSLLTRGLAASSYPFIQKDKVENNHALPPIEEAMHYVTHGQLELAQATLQNAIVQNPHQLDLHYDLLEIFNKTEDKVHFSYCYKQLLEQNIVLPPQWREMAHRFKVEV